MTTTTDKGLTDEELLAIVEAATAGPWSYWGGSLNDFADDCSMNMEWIPNGSPDGDEYPINQNREADGKFIATFDPPMVRALIERARAAERERDHLKEREAHFAKALSVADGGQYRNDWDAAISTILARALAMEEALKAVAPFALGTLDSVIHHSGDEAEVAQARRADALVRALLTEPRP